MQIPLFEKFEPGNITHILVAAVLFFVAVIFSGQTIKNLSFQSEFIETLRDFAQENGYKEPISRTLFILMAVAALFLLILFLSALLKNPLPTMAATFLLLVITAIFGIIFYIPPFRAFTLRENLTYFGEVISGQYHGRDIFIVEEKKVADRFINLTAEERKPVNSGKKTISVSLSMDNCQVRHIRYEAGKIITAPDGLNPDFARPQKMLNEIPRFDKPRVYISEINGDNYLTIEKKVTKFLSLTELYYVCTIAESILDAIDGDRCMITG